MSHTGSLSSFVEEDFSNEFLVILASLIHFMINFEESIRFELKWFLIHLSISVNDCYWYPKSASFRKEVFLSTRTQHSIFENETEGPYRSFETEYFREEGQQNWILLHGENIKCLGRDLRRFGIFEIKSNPFANEFGVLGFGECNNNKPETCRKSICLPSDKSQGEGTPRTKINCNIPLAKARVVGS